MICWLLNSQQLLTITVFPNHIPIRSKMYVKGTMWTIFNVRISYYFQIFIYFFFSISHRKHFQNNKKRFPKKRNQTWWRNSATTVQEIHKLNKKQISFNFYLAYLAQISRMEQGKENIATLQWKNINYFLIFMLTIFPIDHSKFSGNILSQLYKKIHKLNKRQVSFTFS